MNVTTLLVLTTLFISISDTLPRTSYVKAIDVWLITNLLIPFFEIILQSFINFWYKHYECDDTKICTRVSPMGTQKNDDCKDCKSMNPKTCEKLRGIMTQITRYSLPGFYILFCIVFFLYGMITSNA